MTDKIELPDLPHTTYNGYADGSEPLYTAEQMNDYALAAIAAASAKRAPMSDERIGRIGFDCGLKALTTMLDDDQWANIEPRLFKFARALLADAGLHVANAPQVPEGFVLLPAKLTAANGAKAVLSGEFAETIFVECPECKGYDEDMATCDVCDASGEIPQQVPIGWDMIKRIYAKTVEALAAPQPEQKG